ncbi:ATP-binding cassette domain-containing protein [Allokutzneria sp. A3M-2-11 16]|uniref:ATP-binding cassette domain-containing protein n=1 Tax=Allokutzneria sp. A3M-2-11 16 TaxID=2962043 RepID=UPI0020B6B60F|nr:ATP-binding cassette domain-containing protein [Allokutzneria sp. A3M-2-11 16]MCP3804560.1 ATP-binding cassette domain-containing protein [Allokutzneria sp. A3M-2-11 16]
MTMGIQVERLEKHYGDHKAVNGVDLEVPVGTVLGLLGPNGAGKTTTVRMLATLIPPSGGRARVCGYDVATQPQQVRQLIGLTGQYAAVDQDISGRDNLYLIARLLDLPKKRAWARVDELLERFDLVEAGGKLAREYSGGMRRRLDLAASLIGNPRVIYLDEPTTGLDPRSRNALWDVVRDLVAEGSTVLLTTQYMEEAEALADSVVVMDQGMVIAKGTAAELRARVGGQTLRVKPMRPQDLMAVATTLARARLAGHVDHEAGLVQLPISGPNDLTIAVRAIAGSGLAVSGIDTSIPSLDEVFLTLTQKQRGGVEDTIQFWRIE